MKCESPIDGLKVENSKLYILNSEYSEWFELKSVKYCPFCGESLKNPKAHCNRAPESLQ